MRFTSVILLFWLLISSSGCMTHAVVHDAKYGHTTINGDEIKPNSAKYCWTVLTVPLDVVTIPFQIWTWPEVFGSDSTTNHVEAVKKN
jgi:hypothetical protein